MLTDQPLIAFIGASNAEGARAFYGDMLGLRLTAEELPHALVFDAGGTMLRVALVEESRPAQFTVLGWRVDDIETTVDGLIGRGVRFVRYPQFELDERGIWTARDGTRVAWFRDPDGNVLSVTQFPSPDPFEDRDEE